MNEILSLNDLLHLNDEELKHTKTDFPASSANASVVGTRMAVVDKIEVSRSVSRS